MPDSLGTFVHRLSGVYRDPQRVLRDAETLLSSPLGTHLRPSTEPLVKDNGSSTRPLLLLRGTIPMTYKGVTYNLPIDMYMPEPYPLQPPTVFIRPVASMAIKENHRHVGLDGRVYLPYLHEWRPNTHELRELVVWMSSLFGSEPPCYARPPNSVANNPPPYFQATATSSITSAHSRTGSHASSAYSSMSTAASAATPATNNTAEEERRMAFEREISEANRIAEIARRADAEDARVEAERKRLEREHEGQLSSMRATATSKVQSEIRSLLMGVKEELRMELKNQKQLENGKERIEKLLKEGEQQKGQLESGNKEIDTAIEGVETWLKAVKEQEQQSTVENEQSNNGDIGRTPTKADLIALPADTHSAQMVALSAENAAIDDCIYFLDRALVQGGIPLEV
ncbi:hypothetical protein ACHAXR_001166, partial [Thalassiosira sp. AJA248-18]